MGLAKTRHRMRAPVIAVCAVAILLPAAKPALALDPGEWSADAGAGGGLLRASGATPSGGSLELGLCRGLTEIFALRAALGVDAYRSAGPTSAQQVISLSLGTRAALDVVRTIPFAELALVAAAITGDAPHAGAHAGLALATGAEYLLTPLWSLAPTVHAHLFPSAATYTATLHLSRRF